MAGDRPYSWNTEERSHGGMGTCFQSSHKLDMPGSMIYKMSSSFQAGSTEGIDIAVFYGRVFIGMDL